MDFGLAFTFPFQDEKWIEKLLIAGVIMIIPFVGWIAVFTLWIFANVRIFIIVALVWILKLNTIRPVCPFVDPCLDQ